jgi:hypothetical protein
LKTSGDRCRAGKKERNTMVAFPWYLLAAGILIVIIGCFFADLSKLSKPRGSGRRVIDPAMRDDEIIRNLQGGQRISLANLVVLFGLLCIMVSIVWRIALVFVRAAGPRASAPSRRLLSPEMTAWKGKR